MTGNFDYYSTINVNSDNAELTPFWEVAEAEYIRKIELERAEYINSIELQWWEAICADDYSWETYAEELHAIVRETEEILAQYGIRPSVEQAIEKYGDIVIKIIR